jgi:hypothetical protein
MPAFNLQRESYNGSSIKAKFVSVQPMTPRLPQVAPLTQLGHSTQNPLQGSMSVIAICNSYRPLLSEWRNLPS